MLGTFLGLNTAMTGLQSAQAAMDITSHNVANANTPGYSRERVDLQASPALPLMPGGMVGTGVQISQITRLRDGYLDSQYRDQNGTLGSWQAQQNTLQQVTSMINEPSSTGLSTVMQNFWNSWDQLATNPSDLSARGVVAQNAVTVAQTMNQMGQQLSGLQSDLSTNVQNTVNQVNSYLTQLSQLNKEIDNIQAYGQQPNDLMDQRDNIVDKLSNIANVSVVSNSTTPYQLSMGGTVVLNDQTVVPDPNDSTKPLLQMNADGTLTVPVQGGQLNGLEQSISTVKSYQADLDAYANSLANGPATVTLQGGWTLYPATAGGSATLPTAVTINGKSYAANTKLSDVATQDPSIGISIDPSTGDATIPQGTTVTVAGLNGLLAMGYNEGGQSGEPLFTNGSTATNGTGASSGAAPSNAPITASNITVNPDITSDVTKLAAGFTTASGDGTLAATISNLKSGNIQFSDAADATATMPLQQGTLDSFLQAMVGQLGIQGQQANEQVTNQQALVQQIDQQRQSVAGVSIDEEMSNMVQYQQAYNASAKMISTINEMLSTLMQNV